MVALCFRSFRDQGSAYSSEIFETASLMVSGCTFNLVVAILGSLYRSLNGIAHAAKSFYSQSFFPSHYLHGWLAHNFQTHHALYHAHSGPLLVRYSGPLTKHDNIGDVYKMTHEGKVSELGASL